VINRFLTYPIIPYLFNCKGFSGIHCVLTKFSDDHILQL
jgi:hypothetical protein